MLKPSPHTRRSPPSPTPTLSPLSQGLPVSLACVVSSDTPQTAPPLPPPSYHHTKWQTVDMGAARPCHPAPSTAAAAGVTCDLSSSSAVIMSPTAFCTAVFGSCPMLLVVFKYAIMQSTASEYSK